MRAVFGLVGLLVVVAIALLLAKQQMRATPSMNIPAVAGVQAASGASMPANVAEQSQQVQEQVRDTLNQMSQQRTEQIDQQSK